MNLMRLLFLLALVSSSPVYSMTSDEAVDLALRNNPVLLELQHDQAIARGQFEKARLPLIANPTIEGDVSRKDRPQEEGGGKFTNYDVRLSQEVEIAGQRGIRIDVARKEMSRISWEIKDKRRTLVADVKDAFARALAADKKRHLVKEALLIQEDLLNLTRAKYQSGDVSGLELSIAEVQVSRAKKELLGAERERRDSFLTLQLTIGIKSDTGMEIAGELPTGKHTLPDKEALRNSAYAERPDLRAAGLEVEKTQSAVRLIHRESFPNTTLSGFYARDEQKNERGVGVSIPLPLFDRKQAEKIEASAKAHQARIKLKGLENTVAIEFEQAYGNLIAAHEELSIFKEEILTKATENLKLLNFAFKEGKISFFDVRLAERDTLETQSAYIESQLKAHLAVNALEKVIGRDLK